MEEIAAFIGKHHVALLFVLGGFLAATGAIKFLLEKPASMTAAIFGVCGAVFASIPFIAQAEFGPEGGKIVTRLQQNSEDIEKTLKTHGETIANLRACLRRTDGVMAIA